MSNAESSDYEEWVRLANDPSQPEPLRQQYRAKMDAFVRQRLREAFKLASQQATAQANPSKTTKPG